MSRGILLYAELTRYGEDGQFIHPVFFELAAKANELSQKLDNAPIYALLIGQNGLVENFKEGFIRNNIETVYVVEDERLKDYSTEYYSKIAVDVVKELEPEIFIIGATTQGRDLAPRISSALGTGLTADCIDLDINDKGQLAATRPTFGGQLMATILCKNSPQMATVRPKVFKPMKEFVENDTKFVNKKADIDNVEKKVQLIDFLKNPEKEESSLEDAEIIVAGGRGMKDLMGFELLKEFASLLNAKVGASRVAVEMGLASHEMQIGQTGKTVTPKIYIACGISGALQHTVGMSGSDKIIAINTDKNAPIFDIADIAIVGDVFEILPELIEKIKQNKN